MSGEIDILPIADSDEETAQLADRIEGVERSVFVSVIASRSGSAHLGGL